MTNNLKCPICGSDLEEYHSGFVCYRHCLNGKNVWGGEETLKELERTRKALEIAVDALKIAKDCCSDYSIEYLAHKALEQITALEQKGDK